MHDVGVHPILFLDHDLNRVLGFGSKDVANCTLVLVAILGRTGVWAFFGMGGILLEHLHIYMLGPVLGIEQTAATGNQQQKK